MAYDPVKAHEYYIKYRKKGLKKGRKKGSSKTKTGSTTFLGVSSQGFNDEGRIQAALIKEKLKKEMIEALKKATTDEEKEKIRVEYSRKAAQQLAALRSDPKYAKPKAAKKTTGNSRSSSGSSRAKSSASGQKTEEATSTKKAPEVITPAALNEVTPETVTKIGEFADRLKSMAKNLTPEQKASVQKTVQSLIDKLKAFKGALNG